MLKVHNTIIGNEISECRRAAVDVLTSLAQVCYHVYKPYMAIIFEVQIAQLSLVFRLAVIDYKCPNLVL
jgi:hypothetical protein